MAELQQIFDGMNELNERVQHAEARATEAEKQAQATQQEFGRSQHAGAKGKGEGATPLQQEQGIGALASKATSAAVGAQGGRVGGAGSVSTSPPTIRTNFNNHESLKLVDLLATKLSGDFMNSLTDFERRVASWEHESTSELFSTSLCDQHCWHCRMYDICERDRKR